MDCLFLKPPVVSNMSRLQPDGPHDGSGMAVPASSLKERRAGLCEIFDGVDKFIMVGIVQRYREGKHAAFGKPDAAFEKVKPEQVAQCGVAPLGVFLRA